MQRKVFPNSKKLVKIISELNHINQDIAWDYLSYLEIQAEIFIGDLKNREEILNHELNKYL